MNITITDGDVTIGQGEPIHRHIICAFDDSEACAGGMIEASPVKCAHAFQIDSKGICDGFLPSS